MVPSLVDVISDYAEKLLITSASTIKRLSYDEIILKEACECVPNTLSEEFRAILDADKRPLNTLVIDFASDATEAATVLHKTFKVAPKNLNCGSNLDVDRLMLENLNLMQNALEAHKSSQSQILI